MVRFFVTFLLFMNMAVYVYSQHQLPVSLHGFTEMGHHTTMQYYGGAGAMVDGRLTDYFTLTGGAYVSFYKDEVLTRNTVCNSSFVLNGRLDFPLKRSGTIFFENRYLLRALSAYQTYELNAGVVVGYEFSHLSCTVGLASRLITAYHYEPQDGERFVGEPFNMLYRLEGYLFKQEQRRWNVGFRFSNYRFFEISHCSDPYYSLLGTCTMSSQLDVLVETGIHPAGVFSLNAHYYETFLSVGVKYQW